MGFPAVPVHWDDPPPPPETATFDIAVTLPYVSTVTCATFAEEPYVPDVAPLVGNTDMGSSPSVTLDALKFEIPDPLDEKMLEALIVLEPASLP
jgi:hypothetical protein